MVDVGLLEKIKPTNFQGAIRPIPNKRESLTETSSPFCLRL